MNLFNVEIAGMVSVFFLCYICSTSRVWSYSLLISFGGSEHDYGESVKQTSDGGYIITGYTQSFGYGTRAFLAKFHSDSSLDWASTIGEERGCDMGISVDESSIDGGYIVAGKTCDYEELLTNGKLLLAKFYSNGTLDWASTLSAGFATVDGHFVQQTIDGGYIAGGRKDLFGSQWFNVYLAKFFSNGTLDWAVSFGGSDPDQGYSLQQTSDEGYIVTGGTESFGAGDANRDDLFLAKFYSDGSLDWATAVGGTVDDIGYSVRQTNDGGYIVVGATSNFGSGSSDLFLSKFNSSGSLDWSIAFGGVNQDEGKSVMETHDGYIVTGSTESYSYAGGLDILLAKFNLDGTLGWAKTIGGDQYDVGKSVDLTIDGGYIVTGYSKSFPSDGYSNIFLGKVDEDGNTILNEECEVEWINIPDPQITILDDLLSSVDFSESAMVYSLSSITFNYVSPSFSYVEAEDISFGLDCNIYGECYGVFVGLNETESESLCSGHGVCNIFGQDNNNNTGTCECFENYYGLVCNISECQGILSNYSDVVCTGHGDCVDFGICECNDDFFGEFCELRQHPSFLSVMGGSFFDFAREVRQTSEGGYIVTGSTNSFGAGYFDVLLAKYNSDGSYDWGKVLGSTGDVSEGGNSVRQTSDGGYIVTGYTTEDVILIKYFDDGSFDWAVIFGGEGISDGKSVHQTSDGGYVITGYTTTVGAGGKDILVAKFFMNGSLEWSRTFGGSEDEEGRSIQQTNYDEGYIITGFTESFGSSDIVLIKLDADGSLIWAVTLGGAGRDEGYSVLQTVDQEGFVITGSTESFGSGNCDVIIAKINIFGSLEWASVFGGGNDDEGYSVVEDVTTNEGYFIGGYTENFEVLDQDFLLVKFEEDGSLGWASTLGGDDYDIGVSVDRTYDGGFVITGSTSGFGSVAYSDILLAKIYSDDGGGCEEFTRITNTDDYFEFVTDQIDFEDIEGDIEVSVHTYSSTLKILSFLDTPDQFGDVSGETSNMVCSIEYVCFGVSTVSKACSGHGDCIGVNICSCEDNYYGENCDIQYCFGTLSNDTTDSYCSGHGICIDHDLCLCDSNYTFVNDCSFWKCFGKWMNASDVCPGEIGQGLESHGNCTSHDTCECEEGYKSSISCDWNCFGDPHWEKKACNSLLYGICIDYDVCNCTTTYYIGESCDIPTCGSISSLDVQRVCSNGHGECISPDVCECQNGYISTISGYCDWWTCHGIYWDEKRVCSDGKGECTEFNLCNCENSYEGEECETWSCGFDKGDPKTCSGNGKCIGPSDCDCNFGFKGDLCETNTLYATVMAPVLSAGGLAGIVIFLFIVCCCCVCCCYIYCCATCLIGGLVAFLISQTFRWKKFSKLKNIDVLLQEQLADESTDIAHIRINKKLFEIPHKEIKIEKILGDGGSSSVVYLATWKNQKVAYKCFKTRDVCSTQESFDEFETEAEVFSSIAHPNIVGYFGCTLDPPRVGILMVYCENGECLDFIRRYEHGKGSKYPMEERFRMLHEICCAMDYLHSRNIVHRDLKCENVLLNGLEQCKIMDFGLSKISDRLSRQQTKGIGTPLYMAPELVIGGLGFDTTYDEKCDIFSFSIMVFLLITGLNMPYTDTFNIELRVAMDPNLRPNTELMKVALRSARVGEKIEERFIWIIEDTKRCWDHDPMKRPSFETLCQAFVKNKNKFEDEDDGGKSEKYGNILINELLLGGEEKRNNPSEDLDDHFTQVVTQSIPSSTEPKKIMEEEKEKTVSSLEDEIQNLRKQNDEFKEELKLSQDMNRLLKKQVEELKSSSSSSVSCNDEVIPREKKKKKIPPPKKRESKTKTTTTTSRVGGRKKGPPSGDI